MRWLLFFILCAVLIPSFALAHRLYVELKSVPEKVFIECYAEFEGGKACADGDVKVFREEGGVWRPLPEFSGKTDGDGRYRFGPVGVGRYKVVVERIGHRAEGIIEVGGEGVEKRAEVPLIFRVFMGIGYLLGIGGIAFWIKGYRERRSGKDR